MFKRDDLQTGLFVKLKDGDLGVVTGNRIMLQKGTYLDIFDCTTDLKYPNGNGDYDIIEVRGGGMTSHLDCFNNFCKMDLKYKRNSFTKSDIKDGDIVITKYSNNYMTYTEEYKYCKVGTVLISLGRTYESISISNFTEDLEHKRYKEVIIKVYRCNTANDYNMLSDCNIVYERED